MNVFVLTQHNCWARHRVIYSSRGQRRRFKFRDFILVKQMLMLFVVVIRALKHDLFHCYFLKHHLMLLCEILTAHICHWNAKPKTFHTIPNKFLHIGAAFGGVGAPLKVNRIHIVFCLQSLKSICVRQFVLIFASPALIYQGLY